MEAGKFWRLDVWIQYVSCNSGENPGTVLPGFWWWLWILGGHWFMASSPWSLPLLSCGILHVSPSARAIFFSPGPAPAPVRCVPALGSSSSSLPSAPLSGGQGNPVPHLPNEKTAQGGAGLEPSGSGGRSGSGAAATAAADSGAWVAAAAAAPAAAVAAA